MPRNINTIRRQVKKLSKWLDDEADSIAQYLSDNKNYIIIDCALYCFEQNQSLHISLTKRFDATVDEYLKAESRSDGAQIKPFVKLANSITHQRRGRKFRVNGQWFTSEADAEKYLNSLSVIKS